MSISDAQRFARELATNKAFADRIKARAVGLASLVALGKEEGYSFTVDELKQVIRGASGKPLSDAQLERVAGGTADNTQVVSAAVVVITTSPGPAVQQALLFAETESVIQAQAQAVAVQLVA